MDASGLVAWLGSPEGLRALAAHSACRARLRDASPACVIHSFLRNLMRQNTRFLGDQSILGKDVTMALFSSQESYIAYFGDHGWPVPAETTVVQEEARLRQGVLQRSSHES